MGSRKKLVLASLVSLMMALAFIIGLMPLHGALRASAASRGSGRIDMVDLLNAVLNLQAGEPATDIAVAFPPNDANFVVPEGTILTYINFQALAVGDASPVAYAINPDLTEGEWLDLWLDLPLGTNVVFGEQPPFNAVMDVSAVLEPFILEPVTTTLNVYAFANASIDNSEGSLLIYSARSKPTTSPEFSVTKIAQQSDPDQNGLPAPLTAVIGLGQQWRASYLLLLFDDQGSALVDPGVRNVAIANLNPAPDKAPDGLGITVSPEPGIFVTSPTFAQLFEAGLMYENEWGYLIVNSSVDLQLAISEVYDVGNSGGDRAAWEVGVEAVEPPLGRAPWLLSEGGPSPYVEISLLAVDTVADTYREVEILPDTLPVVLELQDLEVDGETPVQLWSYLSWIKDTEPEALDFFFTSVQANLEAAAEIYEWEFADQQILQPGDTLVAELTSLSIFGAFESAMSISDIYPDSASTCTDDPGEVNIVGSFGVTAGTSAGELNGLLSVFFGDLPANIVSAAQVYEVYGEGLVTFAVDAPGSDVPQTVDVTVVDANEEANVALLEQAFSYYDIFTLSTAVQTLDAEDNSLDPLLDVAGGTVTTEIFSLIDPRPAGLAESEFIAGDVLTLTAAAAANYSFVAWSGGSDDLTAEDNIATVTFDRDENEECTALDVLVTAQFQYTIPIEEYFLIINVAPEASATVALDGDVQPLGVELGSFPPGTEVSLNAIADTCYAFDGWDSPPAQIVTVDNPASAETTLTLTGPDSVIEVTANFVPTCYILTVIRDPEDGGTVTIDPVQEEYLATESVTLEAFPNTAITPAYHFVQWVINEQEFRTENPLTLNFFDFAVRDISVRAVFRQNPVLTILETEGGSVDFSPSELCTATPPEQCVVSTELVNGNRVVEYPPLTVVTLTAVPASDEFEFIEWQVDCGSTSTPPECDIPDSVLFDPTITFKITENISVRAIFTSKVFEITSISPDHSWFFGGVVAGIEGTGFMPASTLLFVAGAPVTPLGVVVDDPNSPPTVWFVVPPLPVVPPGQSQQVDVTVSNPPFTQPYSRSINFTYLHYATSGAITTTAFRYTGTTVNTAVALGADLSLASLLLPPPEQSIAQAYGLIRATQQASLIEAAAITEGAPVANAWNFGIHLYNPVVTDVGLNTGAAVHAEITNWTYERAEDTVPAQLEFPTTGTVLDAAAIRNDVMMWSVDTRYEYGENITTLVTPASMDYQSTLEQMEVTPNVTPESPAVGATPITSVVTRLYDLTAFALRTGVLTLPVEFVDAMTVDAPGGTVSGPTSGGTQFTVNAAKGGLAWVTVGFAENITDTTPASATRLGTVIDNGATEFSAVVQAPEWPTDEDTTVDVAIYLNSNLNEPLLIFENAFRYEKVGAPKFPTDILLLLLGLLAALIGLAAGGDSGDGGGPCFIATAAYGTPMAADIDTLRAVRDTYLLESSVGTALVDAYYRVSPAIAGVIAQSPALAAMVRLLLLPVIFASKCLLALPAVSLLAVGVAIMLARIRRRGKVKA